ncbi:MAG: 4Fe-4S binding protein [Candidatus Bathyarchaeota archaeon]|nr:MAG: 4Fe-4S binding protein [Candidatus Bathyarchaeota archaeon]
MPVKLWRKPLDADKIPKLQYEVHIINERCDGCGFCIDFCPKDVLARAEKMNEKGFYPPQVINEANCTFCGFCRSVCPTCAIFPIEKISRNIKEVE